jgi:hypothetical protein
VLQQLLLTASDRDRLLGAADLKEAESILTELKLTSPIDQGLKKSDEILQAIGTWVRAEVETMAPESKRPAFHILWLEEDAPMLSYLLKKHHGLTSAVSTQPLSGMTTYSADALQQLVTEGIAGSLPSHLVEFIKEAKDIKDVTPQSIDSAVAQYVATLQLKLARASGSAALKSYVEHKIDLNNIRTALRKGNDLIVGGSIAPKDLTGDLRSILTAVDRSSLPYDLSDPIRKAVDDPNALEHALSKVMADDIAHMWNIPLSIEPVFAFAALAQSQMKLLRVLLIGKRANMSPQEIKLMLPPFLSASHYVL